MSIYASKYRIEMEFSNEKYQRKRRNQDRERNVLKVVKDDKIPLSLKEESL